MRDSMGGWLEKSAIQPGRSVMPNAFMPSGSWPGSTPPRRRSALTIGDGDPTYCAELAPAREPRDDHRGEDAEHDLQHDDGDEVAGSVAALRLEHGAVDDGPDH